MATTETFVAKSMKHTTMEVLTDVIIYVALMTASTTLSVHFVAWMFIVVPSVAIIKLLQPQNLENQPSQRITKSWLNWFEIAKLTTVVAGVACIVAFHVDPSTYHYSALSGLLIFNIFEAVVSDVLDHGLYGVPNALAGCILMITSISNADDVLIAKQQSGIEHMVLFPISFRWIFLYSSWNAAFTYARNFSPSTRLCLLVAILVAILFGANTWLTARTYSLIFNMLFRASEILWIFSPGKSYVTKGKGDMENNKNVAFAIGVVNAVICVVYWQSLAG
jgi:hypothetical protein